MNNEIGTSNEDRAWFEKQVSGPSLLENIDGGWKEMFESRTHDYYRLKNDCEAYLMALDAKEREIKKLERSCAQWKRECLQYRRADWKALRPVEQFEGATEDAPKLAVRSWMWWVAVAVCAAAVALGQACN